jgi:hypothetical protein
VRPRSPVSRRHRAPAPFDKKRQSEYHRADTSTRPTAAVWAEFGDQSLGNPDAAGLVKLTLVAKRSQEELEGFALEDEFSGYIIDNQMSKIWLIRYRA